MPAALAMAAKAVAPLEQVQRIFAERSKELNTALGEMEARAGKPLEPGQKSEQTKIHQDTKTFCTRCNVSSSLLIVRVLLL